ncbi:MAG: hypothetical protein HeimC3_37120 [Candidatus Heimdallarchaeota archaeon LC_3]|nr:MAG: hypothetical protein HeimC3_37120 [Candidatus Heimdallarchaeota archaeon LC_3]
MSSWSKVVILDQNVINNNFDESEFVLDLEDVISGKGPENYSNSNKFFQRTYLTSKLYSLLVSIGKKLRSGEGSSIYSIKTPFGGGKTHTLITIYHFIKETNFSDKRISSIKKPEKIKIGSIVGTHINPLTGHERSNNQIKTLWGEIAFQLSGEEGFKIFEENDRNQISPGKILLKTFLEKQQPFTLLFDEILEYITKAQGVPVINSDLGAQTLSFLQELMEIVSSLSQGLVFLAVPDLEEEIFSSESWKLLKKFTKVLGRIETIETPVSKLDIFSIIQKRFFRLVEKKRIKKSIIMRNFGTNKYPNKYLDEFQGINLESLFELSYPFHPFLITTLINQWGSFNTFQGIRGVLRFIYYLLSDLNNNNIDTEIILPSDINYSNTLIREEFLKHIGQEYDKIIYSDIENIRNKIIKLDDLKETYLSLYEKISKTIFFHSFSSNPFNGISNENIVNLLLTDEIHSKLINEAIDQLHSFLWYSNRSNNLNFFSNKPNITKIISDIKDGYKKESFSVLKDLISERVDNSLLSIIWPQNSNEIPDNTRLKLVLLHPNITLEKAKRWIEKINSSFRLYKNTIILNSPNLTDYNKCLDLVQNLLAITDIKNNYYQYFIMKDETNFDTLETRLDTVKKDIKYKILSMYNTVIIGEKRIDLGYPSNSEVTLSEWCRQSLIEKEIILNNIHPRVILVKFLENHDKIQTKEILNYLLKSSDLFMIESNSILKKTIQFGIKEGLFGLGNFKDGSLLSSSLKIKENINLKSITFSDKEFLINPDYIQKITKNMTTKSQNIKKKPIKEKLLFNYSIRAENINIKDLRSITDSFQLSFLSDEDLINVNIEFDIKSNKGVNKKMITTMIKETLTQLGATITKEEFD